MFVQTNHAISSITSAHSISSIDVRAHREQRTRARRGLALFSLLLLPLSALCYWLIIARHNAAGTFFLMWTPGFAALVARLVQREQFPALSHHLNWRRVGQALGIALVTPFAIGLLAYGTAWRAGATPLTYFHASATIASFLPWIGANPSLLALAGFVFLIACSEIISATGEELGWRGYMLGHLIDAEVPQPIFVSGLIWSLWHWPLILLSSSTNGLPQLVTASIFLVTITSLGCVSAHLKLTSGSLWPSILLHAAWNGFILEIFDAFTKSADTSIWIGETGLLVALITMLAAFIITNASFHARSVAALHLEAFRNVPQFTRDMLSPATHLPPARKHHI